MKATGYVFKPRVYIGSEPPATVLEDESRFGNNGAFKADGEPDWVQLPSGLWVLNFDHSDDMITVPHHSSLALTAWTITAWEKRNAIDDRQDIVNKRTQGYNYFVAADNYLGCQFKSGGDLKTDYSAVVSVTDLDWHFVAVTFKQPDMVFFVDDASEARVFDWPPDVSDDILVIGTQGFSNWWDGFLTPPKIFNYALSAGQVKKIFEAERHFFGV